jgi:dTDP-4-amino-4,6-dideoxygalactose transaminase
MIRIPFLNFGPMHHELEISMQVAFNRVYNSYWYIQGNELSEFERAYSKLNFVNQTVGVSNGLDALVLCLRVLGIGDGDEVIVPSNTYIATALAVSQVGARPIFVEPNLHTYNINPLLIEDAITPKAKAIMPVHLYGQACEMDIIVAIAKKYGLFIIEDNAQAHLSSFDGKLTGTFGQVNGTSFYPGKNLGALGDAGAITTDNDDLANRLRTLRNYGSAKKYFNDEIGYNNRLDELQAAFLSVKLKYIEQWTNERREIASWYNELLSDVEDLVLPQCHTLSDHVYHLYVVRTQKRSELQEKLLQNGVQTMIHYPVPPHLQKAYDYLGHKLGDFPIAEEIANTCLSLPIWPGMKKSDVELISNNIRSFFKCRQ